MSTVKTQSKKANKVATAKKPTITLDYKVDVLTTNTNYKKAIHGSLGGVRTVILAMNEAEKIHIGLNPIFEKALKDSKGKSAENKRVYEFLKANIRVSKAGNYGIFFTLQSLSGIFKKNFEGLTACYTDSAKAQKEYISLSANNTK